MKIGGTPTALRKTLFLTLVISACQTPSSLADKPEDAEPNFISYSPTGWQPGIGWGWIWGQEDEIGALNAMTDASRLAALQLIQEGRVLDLGILYSRNSFVWPGHSPGEIMSFRTPDGIRRMGDHDFTLAEANPAGVAWHSCALFVNDNIATQIDGLGHLVTGKDQHWYNGWTEERAGGDFGVRACSAAGIPPIINRAVLLDVAAAKQLSMLPGNYAITVQDLQSALQRQKTEILPGDIVLIRTGAIQNWGADGADHERIAAHDSAGITLDTARWLVERKGALAIGSDTSGLEVAPAPEGSDTFVPVHKYLLIEQGVHMLEFHNLEELAQQAIYEFCYIATTNKLAGTTAGFALRPLAMF